MAYIHLNRLAFFHNLDRIKERTGSVDKIALVLKDNAYGHGLREIASMGQSYGIKRAVVRYEHEALILQKYFAYVLVLSDIPVKAASFITYTLNSVEDIPKFPQGTKIELKVDSGMHRNGVDMTELENVFQQAKAAHLRIEGVFTHFRSADTLSSELFWQQKTFEQIKALCAELAEKNGFMPLRFHSKNSAALFRSKRCDDTMVRVGIAAYGCLQMDISLEQPVLKPVLSLWAEKIMTRNVHTSQRIGYNGTYKASTKETVSTYDVGYADGLLRSASNTGYTTPDGSLVLGRISMDNISLKTSVQEVCIFDNANTFAASAKTIGYEVLTGLSPALKRTII